MAQATRVSAQAGVATIEAPRHQTLVDGEALSFVPRDREGATLEHGRFTYTLESVRRGEQILFSSEEGPGQVSAEGLEVRVQRNALVRERTLALDVAAEYVIDLAAAPGAGDLTVLGRVETALEARPGQRGGFDFYQGEELLVAYGAAVAIDAAGRTVDVPLRYEGGLLEMRVPGAWLATAQAPLVIDPLIGSGQQNLTFFLGDEEWVSACYVADTNQYVLAFVIGDDLCVSTLDADGNEVDGGVILDSTDAKGVTAIAAAEPGVDRLLVAYERGDAVYVVVIDSDLDIVSSPARLYDPAGSEVQTNPAVAYDPSRDRWFVVWSDSSSSDAILGEAVNTSGTLHGTVYVIQNLTPPLSDPTIAYSETSDCYLVAFTSGTTGNEDVLGRVFDGALTVYLAAPTISNASGVQRGPSATWNGTDDEFAVAFHDQLNQFSDFDVFLQRLTPGGSLTGSLTSVAATSDDEEDPAVVWGSAENTYWVAFHAWTGLAWDVFGREVAANGSTVGAILTVSDDDENEWFNCVTYNTTTAQFLQAWEDKRAVSDYDIWGRRISSGLTDPPLVLRSFPQDAATGVWTDQVLTVDFDQALDPTTVSGSTVQVLNGGTPLAASVSYVAASHQIQVVTTSAMPSSTQLTLSVGTGVKSAQNVALAATFTATFTTGSLAALADDDSDGLLNVEEAAVGTDANDADDDNDGLDDWEELFVYFTDPTNPDTDDDGTNDGQDSTPAGSVTTPIPDGDVAPVGTFVVTQISPTGTFGSPANVPADAVLAVTFNHPVDFTTVSGSNITLQDQGTLSNVAWTLGTSPNPQTVVLIPDDPLSSGVTYALTVHDGMDAVEDTSGTPVDQLYESVFKVSAPADEGFEGTHYLETLSRTKWERFSLPAPTAGGRNGVAVVVPSTRKLLLAETDVVTRGRGLDVAITRTYRNNPAAASGIFGNNWHFSYDRRFTVVADSSSDGKHELEFLSGDGRIFTYTSNGTSLPEDYESPPGFYDTLKTVTVGSDDLLVQRTKFGTEFFYEFHEAGDTTVEDPDALPLAAVGYLVRVRDRNGNEVAIERHPADDSLRPNAVAAMVDDLDRTTTFTYSTTSGQEDLVEEIEQFQGSSLQRSWVYEYDTARSLIRVQTPASDWSDEGTPRSATRKERSYTYSAGTGVFNLTSVEDGRGNTSLRFFFDENDDVIQVDYGSGADAGTAIYSYRRSPTHGINRASQIDRNGNVLEVEHEDVNSPPFWNIDRIRILTRGLHPNLPFAEPTGYTTKFVHDSDTELIESPNTNVERWIRDARGNVIQYIRKAAISQELAPAPVGNGPDYKREEDIVVEFAYEDEFCQLIRVTEPRGNNADFVGTSSTIVLTTEDVAAQQPRTFKNINAVARDAYTRFLYYDHEHIGDRLTEDSTAIGTTVSLDRPLPRTYGRTATGDFHDPPDSSVFTDADSDGFLDRGGNLYAVREPRPLPVDPVSGDWALARQVIECHFTYNENGQRVLEIEPDGDRNRFEYYVGSFDLTNNPNRGFVKQAVKATYFTDADLDLSDGKPTGIPSGTGLELTVQFTYDVFGNVVSIKNPRGFTTSFTVNSLDLVTKTTSPSPFGYERELLYDGNNNLVEVRIQNVVPTDTNDDGIQDSGEQVEVAAHPDFVHTYTYNTANMLVRRDLDAYGSTPAVLSTAFEYDSKQLLVAIREPEGNVHLRRYDERDLLLETVEGASDGARSASTRYDYDRNRNLIQVIDDDGDLDPQLTIAYDVFDRPTSWTDELGNKRTATYDVASLVRQRTWVGQARGDPGDLPNTSLANEMVEYDELGRAFQLTRELFGAAETLAGMGLTRMSPPVDLSAKRVAAGELVSSTVAFDEDSRVVVTRDDNDHTITFAYDAADRLEYVEDALGSRRTFTYDMASNVIRIADTEYSDDGFTSQVYYAERYWDELNRLIATVSHLGNTRRFLYDSRGNLVQSSDAMAAVGTDDFTDIRTAGEHGTFPQFSAASPAATTSVNGRGNTIRLAYDGVSRPLTLLRDLRADGTGDSSVLQTLEVEQTWDGNGRLRTRVDARGNVTAYAYDHQNRPIRELLADGTDTRRVWNRVDTVAVEVDPRGVTQEFTYDAAERLISSRFSNLPPGVDPTTFKAWRWDGLNRQTRAEDNDSICEYAFDSLSRQVEDVQRIGTGTPRTNASQSLTGAVAGTLERMFDGVGNLRKQTYPTGATTWRVYDEVDRLMEVQQNGTVATFSHIGMGSRRLSRYYPTGSVEQTLAYDGNRRVTRLDAVRTTDDQRVRGFAYGWDREGNRRLERRLTINTSPGETGGVGEYYEYDSLYRLVYDQRDVSSSQLDAISANAATVTAPTPDSTKSSTYVLDAAGNRAQTTVDGVTELYLMEAGLPTLDNATNQYTAIGDTFRTHDAAGNTLSGAELDQQRFFDGENRLIQWTDGTKDVRYRYDASGRRILKRDQNSGFATVLYFYDGWQCVEETTSAGALKRRYVYGEGLDEVVRATLPDAADLDTDLDTSELIDLYYHHNSIGSVAAVTDGSGNVVESYRYSAYGQVRVFDASDQEVAGTQVEQPFMFTGRRLDFEEGSGLYYYRLRYYDPEAGRFVSRDPLGLWGDPGQFGNGQSYCGNNPVNRVDPLGLDDEGAKPENPNGNEEDPFEGLDEVPDGEAYSDRPPYRYDPDIPGSGWDPKDLAPEHPDSKEAERRYLEWKAAKEAEEWGTDEAPVVKELNAVGRDSGLEPPGDEKFFQTTSELEKDPLELARAIAGVDTLIIRAHGDFDKGFGYSGDSQPITEDTIRDVFELLPPSVRPKRVIFLGCDALRPNGECSDFLKEFLKAGVETWSSVGTGQGSGHSHFVREFLEHYHEERRVSWAINAGNRAYRAGRTYRQIPGGQVKRVKRN